MYVPLRHYIHSGLDHLRPPLMQFYNNGIWAGLNLFDSNMRSISLKKTIKVELLGSHFLNSAQVTANLL
ncbi:TPA: hypothetical protein DHW51_03965, partial [Candidatus Poribacteria bacterium]|nr:hypothetical protein [Candidatus Poribacteria bacterium]